MLITSNNISEALADIADEKYLGFDTETYGVGHRDKMFSMQIATNDNAYYFNFKKGQLKYGILDELADMFHDRDKTWFIANAKFDMHKLRNHAYELEGTVHCTQAIERMLYNQYMRYGLDACLKRRGRAKVDAVEKYIVENKLYTMETQLGRKKRIKNKHYDKVPDEIMIPYALSDAREVRFLGLDQMREIQEQDLLENAEIEYNLTKTAFHMERRGIKVDVDYAKKCKQEEEDKLEAQVNEVSVFAGEEFKNGPKWLASAFDKLDQPYQRSPRTGNPIFDKHALEKMTSPIANMVKDIRKTEKYIGTYYSAYIALEEEGMIYATVNQAGTDTGRLSYRDPNLQQVPKEEDFPKGSRQVRKCFVPEEDYCLTMIDYDQQEFRLMLDYAGETQLIRKILDHGECVHQATADMVGVSRKAAKTLNFGLLYGMGTEKLAQALKITVPEAKEYKSMYFGRLPKVLRLIDEIISAAKYRGYIKTWTGRKLYFPDPEFAYKAPNHLIQGGCGDIAKIAMYRCEQDLIQARSKLLVQVHDELLFKFHKNELDLVRGVHDIMEKVYTPFNGMRLTCGVDHSWVSWGKQDVVEGYPRIEI
jgi:DNA polymerase-1